MPLPSLGGEGESRGPVGGTLMSRPDVPQREDSAPGRPGALRHTSHSGRSPVRGSDAVQVWNPGFPN